uniref:Uncharacterized protein n=1 Tax=Romanomermis culicivorax TaxID=13658 RepID=A0A915K948_ROMCU
MTEKSIKGLQKAIENQSGILTHNWLQISSVPNRALSKQSRRLRAVANGSDSTTLWSQEEAVVLGSNFVVQAVAATFKKLHAARQRGEAALLP